MYRCPSRKKNIGESACVVVDLCHATLRSRRKNCLRILVVLAGFLATKWEEISRNDLFVRSSARAAAEEATTADTGLFRVKQFVWVASVPVRWALSQSGSVGEGRGVAPIWKGRNSVYKKDGIACRKFGKETKRGNKILLCECGFSTPRCTNPKTKNYILPYFSAIHVYHKGYSKSSRCRSTEEP